MKKFKIFAALAIVTSIFFAGQASAPKAANAEPGSSGDPVVAESYLKSELGKLSKIIDGLESEIDSLQAKVATLEKNGSSSGSSSSGSSSSGSSSTSSSIGTGVVTATTLNMRSGAGTSYSKVGTLYKGNKVTLLKKTGSWYQVKYGSVTGWISGDYITVSSSSNTSSTQAKNGVVTASSLTVRKGAGTSYSKIGSLLKGAKVSILKTSSGWHQITYGSTNGWVSSEYIKIS